MLSASCSIPPQINDRQPCFKSERQVLAYGCEASTTRSVTGSSKALRLGLDTSTDALMSIAPKPVAPICMLSRHLALRSKVVHWFDLRPKNEPFTDDKNMFVFKKHRLLDASPDPPTCQNLAS